MKNSILLAGAIHIGRNNSKKFITRVDLAQMAYYRVDFLDPMQAAAYVINHQKIVHASPNTETVDEVTSYQTSLAVRIAISVTTIDANVISKETVVDSVIQSQLQTFAM